MELTYFIGVDVSKNDLDFAVMQNKAFLFHHRISNSPAGVEIFFLIAKVIPKVYSSPVKLSLVCEDEISLSLKRYFRFLLSIPNNNFCLIKFLLTHFKQCFLKYFEVKYQTQ